MTFSTLSTSTFLDRAGQWFLDSGIQAAEGGVARYRRTDTGRNLPISNEITGYAVSTLFYLHALTARAGFLDRALAAARFLTRRAWNPELRIFPFEYVPPGNGFSYFFDCGIIARGLLAAWRATDEPEFLEIARACGESMAAEFAGGDSFHPILRLPEKRPVECDHRWSRAAGCYQLKSAMVWFDLYEATGRMAFRENYCRMLDYALRTHASFLPGDPDPHRVMDRLHAYCYFLEGMLPVAGEPRCATALAEGIARVAGHLREIAPAFARSDVYAQLLRLRLCAQAAGIVTLDREAAAWEAERLAAFQAADGDAATAGGFWFGRKGAETLPFINPVSTGFGLQALALWCGYAAGGPPLDRRSLI
jgi:hypothetical protein